jgi:hypothetical protein
LPCSRCRSLANAAYITWPSARTCESCPYLPLPMASAVGALSLHRSPPKAPMSPTHAHACVSPWMPPVIMRQAAGGIFVLLRGSARAIILVALRKVPALKAPPVVTTGYRGLFPALAGRETPWRRAWPSFMDLAASPCRCYEQPAIAFHGDGSLPPLVLPFTRALFMHRHCGSRGSLNPRSAKGNTAPASQPLRRSGVSALG